jgi:hypothetical protein
MIRRRERRLADPRRLSPGLLLALALALTALPAAAASRALQAGEDSYTDPTFGWSISWDPATWLLGGETPTPANDDGLAGNAVVVAGIDPIVGAVLVGSQTSVGGDLGSCLDAVPAQLSDLVGGITDVGDADLELPEAPADAEQRLVFVSFSGFNGVLYVECRPLVENQAVLGIAWILPDATRYSDALPAFAGLMTGLDLSGVHTASETGGAAKETFTDPFIGWSLTYDPRAWTLEAQDEFSDSASGERVLTSSGAGLWGNTYQSRGNVYIFGDTAFGDDTAACLESLRQGETAGSLEIEAAELEAPTAPDDAEWELYVLNTGGGSTVVYFACLPLIEDESVLRISWRLGNPDRYEDALSDFNRLLAGLDLSEVHVAGEGQSGEDGDAGNTETFTDPIYGWTIAWDPEQWEADGPSETVGENGEPGTQMDFLGRDYEGMGYVRIGSVATSLDPAGCVEFVRPRDTTEATGDGAYVEDLREPDLPLPAAPSDAAGRLFEYAPGDQMTYLECRPLVAGEAVLVIDWYLSEAARYETALPAFEALIAGLELPGGEPAGVEPSDAHDEASEELADDSVIEAEMEEVNGSGVNGTAVVSDESDGLAVTIHLEGAFAAGLKPYVHAGTCAAYDSEPIFSLQAVDESGLSESRQIAVGFDDLTAEPHVIVLYVSRTDKTVLACGELAP